MTASTREPRPRIPSGPGAGVGASLDARVREHARSLGFDRVGVARADVPLGVEHERYRRFIEAGMHGAMSYLERHVEPRRRLDGPTLLEGARSVICLARRYARPDAAEAADPPLTRDVARYARGRDYHNHLRRKLRHLAAFVRSLGEGVEARPLCDVEPVLERVWAQRAGLGFVGKNGLVIVPGQGSYVLLGEVVTTLELVPDSPMTDRCGSCTRCLDACPTSAFDAPFVLDPRRCIAYLTIEQPEAPPEPLRSAVGEHLFGCDVCQEVCPYNRTAPPPLAETEPFHPLPRWGKMKLADLVRLDEPAFLRVSEGTPLRRARRAGLARNAVLVAAARLRRDASDADADAALLSGLAHDAPVVREVAAWGRAAQRGPGDGRDASENPSDPLASKMSPGGAETDDDGYG